MYKSVNRLNLNREAIRELTGREIPSARGGVGVYVTDGYACTAATTATTGIIIVSAEVGGC